MIANQARKAAQTLVVNNKKVYGTIKFIYHQMNFMINRLALRIKFGDIVSFKMSSAEKQKAYDQGFRSQYGQDYFLVKNKLIPPNDGKFVDVGCNKPVANSNTYFFENFCNYSGIGIDALPGLEASWKKERPRTKFLNVLISEEEKLIEYSVVKGPEGWEHQLSGITSDIDLSNKNYCSRKIEMKAVPLSKIIKTHFKDQTIDLLSIDVEGHELEVLNSIDWKNTDIKVIVMENNIRDLAANEKRRFLIDKGFNFIARVWIADDIFISSK